MLCRKFKTAIASAAPSVGSVPEQSSSKRQSELASASFKIETIFVIWAENVLRFCSMLCSSPMSANTLSKTANSDPSNAGIWSPDCPIRVKSPTVFKETVLPPVFGPVTIRRSNESPTQMLIGTTCFGFKSGWRPSLILIYRLLLNFGSTQL